MRTSNDKSHSLSLFEFGNSPQEFGKLDNKYQYLTLILTSLASLFSCFLATAVCFRFLVGRFSKNFPPIAHTINTVARPILQNSPIAPISQSPSSSGAQLTSTLPKPSAPPVKVVTPLPIHSPSNPAPSGINSTSHLPSTPLSTAQPSGSQLTSPPPKPSASLLQIPSQSNPTPPGIGSPSPVIAIHSLPTNLPSKPLLTCRSGEKTDLDKKLKEVLQVFGIPEFSALDTEYLEPKVIVYFEQILTRIDEEILQPKITALKAKNKDTKFIYVRVHLTQSGLKENIKWKSNLDIPDAEVKVLLNSQWIYDGETNTSHPIYSIQNSTQFITDLKEAITGVNLSH